MSGKTDSTTQQIVRVDHPLARGAFFATWFLVVANLFNGGASSDQVENVLTALVGGPFAGWTVALAVGTLVSVVGRLRGATRPDGESDQEDANASNAQDDVVPKQPRLAQFRADPALLVTLGVVAGLVVGVVGTLALADGPGDAEPKVVDTYCSPRIKIFPSGSQQIEGLGFVVRVYEDGSAAWDIVPAPGVSREQTADAYRASMALCVP